VNSGVSPRPFYKKHLVQGKLHLTLTDHLLQLKDSFHFQTFALEVDAKWQLVETAWNLQLNPNLLVVQYNEAQGHFFIERNLLRQVNITSVREAVNSYQKGKGFYSFQDISVSAGSDRLCQVDHFLPHVNKATHLPANSNGVWNLVLADRAVNTTKSARVPRLRFLQRLYQRKEFFIESQQSQIALTHSPLADVLTMAAFVTALAEAGKKVVRGHQS
jgi:hypothetical protein